MAAVQPLLDPVAAAVEQHHERVAVLYRLVGELGELVAADASVRSAKHRVVKSRQADRSAVDLGETGDHAVCRRLQVLGVEGVALGFDESADLVEAAGVGEYRDALARAELAGGVLARDRAGAGVVEQASACGAQRLDRGRRGKRRSRAHQGSGHFCCPAETSARCAWPARRSWVAGVSPRVRSNCFCIFSVGVLGNWSKNSR